jgi:cytochrome bd ubiquinol oxidase subunit II
MGPEHALAAVMVIGLVIYVLGGGADFGGGVWDLLARGPRKEAQRALIERAIGPIWEANHVWFIFVFVLLFSAFPPAFARLVTILFTPLTAYAVGIVLRGAAFTFRHYASSERLRRGFGRVFSIASVMCPWLLGYMGALLLRPGDLRADADAFAITAGFFVVALVSALAATYLTVESEGALQEDFRRRAITALVVAGMVSWIALVVARHSAPAFGYGAVASVLGLGGLSLLARRRFRAARIVVALLAGFVVVAWAASKGETLAAPMSIATAKAHPGTLVVLLTASVVGFVVLAPSMWLLFRAFGRIR